MRTKKEAPWLGNAVVSAGYGFVSREASRRLWASLNGVVTTGRIHREVIALAKAGQLDLVRVGVRVCLEAPTAAERLADREAAAASRAESAAKVIAAGGLHLLKKLDALKAQGHAKTSGRQNRVRRQIQKLLAAAE